MKARRLGRPPIHGAFDTKEYKTWAHVRAVCNNIKHARYPRVGGLGIKHDPEWESFEAFLNDMGPCPEGHTFRRMDAEKDFTKDNCEWAPSKRRAD